jgi:co-chaperonin GroES (HSP10)
MTTLVKPDGSAIATKLKNQEADIPTDPKDISQMLDKIPDPTGWRILVRPYIPPKKTKGGIYMSDESQERVALATVCALVIKCGPLCYKDETKFPDGAWCKEGDWVIFGRYAGSRFKTELGEVRILNDDEIIGTVSDPENIIHNY